MSGPRSPSGYWLLTCEWYQYVPGCVIYFESTLSPAHVRCLANIEIICKTGPWRDGTLADACNAIHMGCTIHEETVEMKRSGLVAQIVLHIHNHSVAHSGLDPRKWPLAVDTDRWPVELSIGICDDPANSEVVYTSSCICRRTQK